MTPYYKCTYDGFCEGQNHTGLCRVSSHRERLACPYIGKAHSVAVQKTEIDPRKPGVKDPDTPPPYGVSLWAVQQLLKERRP